LQRDIIQLSYFLTHYDRHPNASLGFLRSL
jgi:hypothetical protein